MKVILNDNHLICPNCNFILEDLSLKTSLIHSSYSECPACKVPLEYNWVRLLKPSSRASSTRTMATTKNPKKDELK